MDDKIKSCFAILFLQKWPLPNIQAQCQSSMKVSVQLHVLLPLGGHQQVCVFHVSLIVTAKGKEPHPITSHVTDPVSSAAVRTITWCAKMYYIPSIKFMWNSLEMLCQHILAVCSSVLTFQSFTMTLFMFKCSAVSVIVYHNGFYSIMFPISCLSDFTSLIYFCLISFLPDSVSLALHFFHIS
jgi:hypothetical protein